MLNRLYLFMLTLLCASCGNSNSVATVELDRSKSIEISHEDNVCIYLPNDVVFTKRHGGDFQGGEISWPSEVGTIYYYVGRHPTDLAVIKQKEIVSTANSGRPIYRYDENLAGEARRQSVQVEYKKKYPILLYVEMSYEPSEIRSSILALKAIESLHQCR